jgi:hypothetical protein
VNIALTTAYACAPVSGVLSEAVFVVVVVIVLPVSINRLFRTLLPTENPEEP